MSGFLQSHRRYGRLAAAFTLIELLVVVAIIAILAAIAVPNFLEAMVRAKVSRVRADLRTVTTVLETYRIDNTAYPPNDGVFNVLPRQITTPVAYLSNSKMIDPFCEREMDRVYGELARYYTYGKIVDYQHFLQDARAGCPPAVEVVDMTGFNPGAMIKYGFWRMVSNGPDKTYSSRSFMSTDPVLLGADIVYDPSNGTVSWGNLLCTQKLSTGIVGH